MMDSLYGFQILATVVQVVIFLIGAFCGVHVCLEFCKKPTINRKEQETRLNFVLLNFVVTITSSVSLNFPSLGGHSEFFAENFADKERFQNNLFLQIIFRVLFGTIYGAAHFQYALYTIFLATQRYFDNDDEKVTIWIRRACALNTVLSLGIIGFLTAFPVYFEEYYGSYILRTEFEHMTYLVVFLAFAVFCYFVCQALIYRATIKTIGELPAPIGQTKRKPPLTAVFLLVSTIIGLFNIVGIRLSIIFGWVEAFIIAWNILPISSSVITQTTSIALAVSTKNVQKRMMKTLTCNCNNNQVGIINEVSSRVPSSMIQPPPEPTWQQEIIYHESPYKIP